MEKNKEYSPKSSAFVYILALLLPTIVALIIKSLIMNIAGAKEETAIYSYIAMAVMEITLLLIVITCSKFTKRKVFNSASVKFNLNLSQIILIITMGLVAMLSFMPFMNMFQALLQKCGYVTEVGSSLRFDNFGLLVVNIVIVGLLPGICEEFVFRGVVYKGIKKYGETTAILLSAVMFMLFHMNLEQTIYQFFLGVVLALVVSKTGSLVASIIVHSINNIVVIISNYISYQKGIDITNVAYDFSVWNVIYPILLAIFGVVMVLYVAKVLGLVTRKKQELNINVNNQLQNKEANQNIANNNDLEKEIINNKEDIAKSEDVASKKSQFKFDILNEEFQERACFIFAIGLSVLMWVIQFIAKIIGG